MRKSLFSFKWMLFLVFPIVVSLLTSCASTNSGGGVNRSSSARFAADYSSRMPQQIDTGGKKTIVVNPQQHVWGAYNADGTLARAGIATSGGRVCPPDDDEADCRTGTGTFHIYSLGGEECYSKRYPKPDGGGLMPFCMYFNKGQALHGSPDSVVIEDNVSHGCVRMRIPDAEWMRNNFAQLGTKVIVLPY